MGSGARMILRFTQAMAGAACAARACNLSVSLHTSGAVEAAVLIPATAGMTKRK